MPPYRVRQAYISLPIGFAAAESPGQFVMEHGVISKPEHCVAGGCLREGAPYNYVTRQNIGRSNLVKSIGSHIFQVEVFSPNPPSVSALEVWQVDAAQMVGVPEKRVAIHHAMFKPASQQMRYRPELSKSAITCQPPFNAGRYLRHPVGSRKNELWLWMGMKNGGDFSRRFRSHPVCIAYAKVSPRVRVLVITAHEPLAINNQATYFITG